MPAGEPFAGRTRWWRRADPSDPGRANHVHHPDEIYRLAFAQWQGACDALLAANPGWTPQIVPYSATGMLDQLGTSE